MEKRMLVRAALHQPFEVLHRSWLLLIVQLDFDIAKDRPELGQRAGSAGMQAQQKQRNAKVTRQDFIGRA
jgi:hypothetical protein